MSPDQGRKGMSGKGGGAKASGPVATRRLGLILFGVTFLALFIVVAVSEGLGDPSVPSGDVALVDGVGSVGEVSKARFDHALELAAVAAGEEKAPKPGAPKYEEIKVNAMKSLFEGIWLQGLAEEWDVEVTDAEVTKRVEKLKEENFKTDAAYKTFLKETHYTLADVEERVKIQILGEELQAQLKENAPDPTQGEIENYYEAAKSTQFTQKPSRDVRLVINKDQKKAEAAFEALSKDNSETNWQKVAKKYSEDPTSKASGGLQKGLQEGSVEEPINKAIFGSQEGQLEGPTKAPRGYVIFEVVSSAPESVQDLKAVENQIQSTLAQRLEQEYFTAYVTTFNTTWTSRTFCAADYVVELCSNFEQASHPPTAPPGCYEADPKGGLPEACPAPVSQLAPALPGTVTPLQPRGKALPQRPRPLEEAGKATEGATGLPEGAVPPAGEEAPPEEAPPESE